MHRHLQFGMRENPASIRRHDSRLGASGTDRENCIRDGGVTSPIAPSAHDQSSDGPHTALNAASPRAAAGGEMRGTNDSHAVASAHPHPQKAALGFEPLIGSAEAAKLLGNIHVKTLQRYARHKRVPGYQIGGHWYFRASELDSWLRSQINLSCHPCRLQEKSDGT